MAGKRTEKRVDTDGVRHQGRGTSLGDILRARGLVPAAPARENDAAPSAPVTGDDGTNESGELQTAVASTRKIVLRREKKGRGGKTVTRVEGLDAPEPVLEALAKAMRRDLGCGGTVEDGVPVLQGDVGDRAADWLIARGAARVVRG